VGEVSELDYLFRFGTTREQMLARSRDDIERGAVKISMLPEDEILNVENVRKCFEAGMAEEAICTKLHCSPDTLAKFAGQAGYGKRLGKWVRAERPVFDAVTVAGMILKHYSVKTICTKFGIDEETFWASLKTWGLGEMKHTHWARRLLGVEQQPEPSAPNTGAIRQQPEPEAQPVPEPEQVEEPVTVGVDMASGPDRTVVRVRDASTGEILEEGDSITDMIARAKSLIAKFQQTESECTQEADYLYSIATRCAKRCQVLERMIADLEESEKPEAAS
jgi:hypothetical protein